MPQRLLTLARRIDGLVITTGKAASWLAVVMMLVIVFDVVARRYFNVGSVALQELEWHLHGALFLLTIGFAYLRGAHVRIELIRDKWTNRTKLWVEFLGTLLFLIPYTIVLMKFGFDYAAIAFGNAETSATAGLGFRWLIKGLMVVGFLLMGLAGLSNLIKTALALFGPPGSVGHKDLDVILDDHPETT